MDMDSIDQDKLLHDKRVIEEINRHLWIESEKAGRDIGFEKAKEDWLQNFSKAWMKYHMPQETLQRPKGATPKTTARASSRKKARSGRSATSKRRRAKSYI